jgi:ABC-2 type transport system permease protein
MDRLWTIVRREYLERVRSKWFVYSTLLAPILFGALILLPLWFTQRSMESADVSRIIVLDATGTGLGKRIAAELNGGPMGDTSRTPVVETGAAGIAAAEREATARVMRRDVKGYLVLGAGSLDVMRARYAGSNASSETEMRRLEQVVRGEALAIRMERAGLDPSQVRSITARRFEIDAERLTEKGRGGSGEVRAVFALSVAFLLYIAIFIYGQNVLRGVMEEKQTRVAEVVVSSVPATQLMAGKVLGVGGAGVTQLLLATTASWAVYQARAPLLAYFGLPPLPYDFPHISLETAALLLAFFLLGYLFYAAIFAAVGAMVSSETEAQQVQLPVAMMLVMSALFIQPVLFAPESRLAMALSVIPFSAPIIMPLRLSVVELPMVELLLSLVVQATWCWIAVWLAARIYRTGLLMYGKRPTLRELARWVRHP